MLGRESGRARAARGPNQLPVCVGGWGRGSNLGNGALVGRVSGSPSLEDQHDGCPTAHPGQDWWASVQEEPHSRAGPAARGGGGGLLHRYIIGKKGETKKRLETETRTSISIPKPGVEGEIVITGQQRGGVISARTRVDVLLDSFRKKQPFTHFLSFALNQPVIQERFLQFKEEVLEKCSQDHGVSSSLFQNPAKLHLTLGTLVLLNEQEIQRACELLQQCKEDFVDQITGGKPLTVEVAGVEYMNDDPAMMDVLYAKVHMKDGSDKLQAIADQLVERFVASGLMLREWDRVKLHATVMNTLFRKDPSGAEERSNTVTGKSSFKERESFNGRNVLKLFENFSFGEAQLDAVLLSQRYSSDASRYYGTAGQLALC
ncbi:activating signal cointegrator 1 complex subunit 1 isoform X5 [Numida meleagris]|uniref:activating signal cointegrator 1 complex subunit 1 isoform X5 n=1 Tax=Numida meleagris TaxID=8996 RepID=UPI000B3DA551|nr:activating signal cointegrator 1 complex subunit 1 isoform X5 [Numida meleagris]